MKNYEVLFWDTDGTLLDTLEDIVSAINLALKEAGFDKQYSYDEGKKLIGNGSYVTVARAISFTKLTPESYLEFQNKYLKHYDEFQNQTTKPYEGLIPLLLKLKKKYKLFIVSNKPQFLLDEIIAEKFPKDLFIEVLGHRPENPEKPNPILINQTVEKYHLDKSKCLYIGDSNTDADTAINAQIDCCLVTYGYGDYTPELLKKATYVANSVDDLATLLK